MLIGRRKILDSPPDKSQTVNQSQVHTINDSTPGIFLEGDE